MLEEFLKVRRLALIVPELHHLQVANASRDFDSRLLATARRARDHNPEIASPHLLIELRNQSTEGSASVGVEKRHCKSKRKYRIKVVANIQQVLKMADMYDKPWS